MKYTQTPNSYFNAFNEFCGWNTFRWNCSPSNNVYSDIKTGSESAFKTEQRSDAKTGASSTLLARNKQVILNITKISNPNTHKFH